MRQTNCSFVGPAWRISGPPCMRFGPMRHCSGPDTTVLSPRGFGESPLDNTCLHWSGLAAGLGSHGSRPCGPGFGPKQSYRLPRNRPPSRPWTFRPLSTQTLSNHRPLSTHMLQSVRKNGPASLPFSICGSVRPDVQAVADSLLGAGVPEPLTGLERSDPPPQQPTDNPPAAAIGNIDQGRIE